MHFNKLLVATATILASHSALAVDNAYVEYGSASKVKMVRLGATQDFKPEWTWFKSNGTQVTGYWDVSIGAWEGDRYHNLPGAKQRLVDIGFTPVFRYENISKKGFYVEGGVGAHLMSKTYNNNDDRLSTAFQFGDHIGIGYVFDNKWEVAAKLQHFSNGGIKKPNSGVDFFVLRASYRY